LVLDPRFRLAGVSFGTTSGTAACVHVDNRIRPRRQEDLVVQAMWRMRKVGVSGPTRAQVRRARIENTMPAISRVKRGLGKAMSTEDTKRRIPEPQQSASAAGGSSADTCEAPRGLWLTP